MNPHVPTEARFYLLILFPTHINARDGGRCFFEQQFPYVISPVFIIGCVTGIYPGISPILAPFSRSEGHFSTNSGKTSTIVPGSTRFSVRSIIGGYIAAGNNRNNTNWKAKLCFYGLDPVE